MTECVEENVQGGSDFAAYLDLLNRDNTGSKVLTG